MSTMQQSKANIVTDVNVQEHFRETFVDVLDEVGESSHLSSPGDVLRIYDIWAKTGSLRAANKLRKMGLEPLPHAGLNRQN